MLLKRLLPWLKLYRFRVVTAVILAFLSSALTVVLPVMIKRIAEEIQKGLSDTMDISQIVKASVISLLLILVSFAFSYILDRLLVGVTVGISKSLREQMGEKVDRIPISYYDTVPYGDILSRLTHDVDTLTGALSGNMVTIFTSAVQVAGCLIMMFFLNWCLAICVVVSAILGIVISTSLSAKSKPRFKAQQRGIGELNGLIEESLSGQLVIKAFNCEEDVQGEFDSKNKELYDTAWRSQFLSSLMIPVMQFSGNLSYVIVCVFGAVLAMRGFAGTTVPVIISFILYARLFSTPLTQISHAYRMVMPSLAAAERIFAFLDIDEMENDDNKDEDKESHALSNIKGDVSFTNIRFGYVEEIPIIHNFSAEVKAGQKVAIVGPTGAGKSTMINLLMRFYELWGGSISIDGVPINSIPRSELHSKISMVLQDTWTFEGSIRENVVYNTPGVTDEKLKKVIEDVGLTYFVDTLPDGVDTIISESSSISAGQKQLLTIARAMLENHPILILDEATSSVDTRLEKIIQSAIDKLTSGRTSFVIAHRLSTIRNADVIFVMKDGDVVETGDHDTLMQKGGLYANLYNSQFERT